MKNETRKITLAGMFIALGIILAKVFHVFQLGAIISPMHITVMLAGIVLGWKYGLAVGVITPIINSIMFTNPPLYPIAIGMALELATYGIVIAIAYKYLKPFKKNVYNIYLALIIAMIIGRIMFGIYFGVLLGIINGFGAFITNAIVTPLPGIILQILLIPAITVFAEKKEF